MAFRGTSDKLYTPNNGKFLGFVQILAKFHLAMQEHLRLAMKGDISDHSASVHRWKILTDHLGLYTIKKHSDTRWEARISSVTVVRYQISTIHDALITLALETQKTDVQMSHEATILAEQLKDFSFIVSLVVWYDILHQINVEDYRNTGFKSAILTAKELAEELEIERQAGEIARDDAITSPKKKI
ncbi:uncharacterized protein LOC113391064 [Ctenocephalides felis]|uniref:uncharacterized protein LOC113391064 n=1 Tax=Ctenocephalides felis TaxID=7515 RepID=UPI000E6E19BE|nr:uncharacterized protein LOC113391064 [Ctenocephalides felis]